ncbi:hypothetical protein D3C86_1998770 [compost metagenome]
MLLLNSSRKLNSIHIGHININECEVRGFALNQLKCFNPVLRFTANANAVSPPINRTYQVFSKHRFIIRYDRFIHSVHFLSYVREYAL